MQFGTQFSDFLDGNWDQAKGYLKEELEQLKSALQNQFSQLFDNQNVLLPGAIQGDSTIPTRYVANTGPKNAPNWDLVNLSNGVKSKLALKNFVSAAASTLLGRESGTPGDYEPITLGPGLTMSGTVLNAAGATTSDSGTFTLMLMGG